MMKHITPNVVFRGCMVLSLSGVLAVPGHAGTIWDGGGGADTSWGTPVNWDGDTLPAFDGTDSLTVTAGFGVNTALTLGADRSIGRITFGGGTTAISLSGHTLRLNSTSTTAGAGAALWNANTNDGVTATVNSNILLQSGTAGSYTGHFRENINSNGGTRFNGSISQGAGENWTMWFTRASTRGTFFLNNASNSIFAIRNAGADVYSEVAGAFGGASLTLAGGITGTRVSDHYTTAVNNGISLTAASNWTSFVQTRLTGNLSQGGNTLTYGGSTASQALTRLEYASVSGTGATTLSGATVAASAMSQLASGTLNLGNATSGAQGVLVLSGASAHGVPTWSDFTTARTYNDAGGSGTWRINVAAGAGTNTYNAGGFAARGADLVIPASGGGLSSAVFTRNFMLGSAATLDGNRYANHAVKIETDIAYGTVNERRYFGAAHNQEVTASSTNWALGGPVHELAGQITGDSVIIYPMGTTSGKAGVVRISNASNSLTGTSRWILGGSRDTFTTLGGGSITGPGNMGDLSNIVLIFTSDAAFGGATEVQVSSRGSSGTATVGMLLFEDTNGAGSTTFSRNFNVVATSVTQGAAAWGSYAGDVIYNGTVTYGGGQGAAPVHVQSGTLALNGATFTNNRSAATIYHKGGAGELIINGLTIGGTQSSNNWNVQQGKMTVNTSLPTGNVTVFNGSTLGGNGTVNGNVVFSTGGGTLAPGTSPGTLDITGNLTLTSLTNLVIELGGALPGDGSGFYDQVNVSGTAALADAVLSVSTFGGFNPAGGVYYILSRTGGSGTFFGLGEGDFVSIDGGMGMAQITYLANWTGDQSTSSLTGGNDVALYNVEFIPEPGSLALIGLGSLLIGWRKRR
jgi:fibronectin-binding autotransporter adhesin